MGIVVLATAFSRRDPLVIAGRSQSGDGPTSLAAWADESSCFDCHSEAASFARTGHPRTLTRATAAESRDRLKMFAGDAHADTRLRVDCDEDGCLVRLLSADASENKALAGLNEFALEWCFGSGRHAQTWVGTLPGSWGETDLVEFRWTWYAAKEGFDVTPGQPLKCGDWPLERFGVLFDHPKAERCFRCHSTVLPISQGKIVEQGIVPGVQCQRCHGPLGRHVASDGETPAPRLADLSAEESISRCGECHRRAEEQKPGAIRPDNADLARFQPVGLTQSACYKKSEKLTCLTCHDPHRPLDEQDSLGDWQCLQCHQPEQPKHRLCSAGHRQDCLGCHMPKVRGSSPVDFTDHWIRVRSDRESGL